jgi:hypothetical protein
MMSHHLPAKTDGSRCVDLFEVSECSDGMTILVAPQNLNAINHVRRTEGGAFPLPSAVDLPLLRKRPNLARLSESAVSFQIGFSRTWEDLRWHLGPG